MMFSDLEGHLDLMKIAVGYIGLLYSVFSGFQKSEKYRGKVQLYPGKCGVSCPV